jgi:hypothetical protein
MTAALDPRAADLVRSWSYAFDIGILLSAAGLNFTADKMSRNLADMIAAEVALANAPMNDVP